MSFKQSAAKQVIDLIEWNDPDDGTLAWRFPMQDAEILTGAHLIVGESQFALFVDKGKIADLFIPGSYTLDVLSLQVLSSLQNWGREPQPSFKCEVYFFSTRPQIDQRWGTGSPIVFRDKEFGAASMRAHGVYSYRVGDPRTFYTKVSSTLGTYHVVDIEGQLRAMIVGCVTEIVGNVDNPFLHLTADLSAVNDMLSRQIKPAFTALGLQLDRFTVQNISLPDDIRQLLDQRIGMSIELDLGQFAAAESLPDASKTADDLGIDLDADFAIAQAIAPEPPPAALTEPLAPALRYCIECGIKIPPDAKFCPACGKRQP